MKVLVINSGSSSLKADVLHTGDGTRVLSVLVERVGQPGAVAHVGGTSRSIDAPDHARALRAVLPALIQAGPLEAVGHRVVHGGESFTAPTLIEGDVLDALGGLVPLAPLHLPGNLAGIQASLEALPELPHVAVFDTAFHASLPRRARTYPLSHELRRGAGLRKYGFHGPSHHHVTRRAATYLQSDVRDLRIVSCHLGNGSSACAVELGRSVETTMGLTPLGGLVMGTRPGDLDPGVILHLLRHGYSPDAIDAQLHRHSGLAGLSGTSGDLRDILERSQQGDDPARLAIQVFTHRLTQAIASMAASMAGLDVLVFTAGIGQNSPIVRQRACAKLGFLGVRLDDDLNRDAKVSHAHDVAEISHRHSRVKVLVIATDESLAIARDAAKIASGHHKVSQPRTIPIAVSARHVHLTQEAVEILFGKGHTLTPRNPLSQPGQFACEETVDLLGPRRTIERVRVLGPTRRACQVEVARTDEFFLGIDAPVRASGDLDGTPGITLRGPRGKLELKQGVICAWRHIHMTPQDAEDFGVKDRDIVEVEVGGGPRRLIFGDVLVRVHNSFALEMHIDTDEANAAELDSGTPGELVRAEAGGSLRRRRVLYDTPVP
ncbi:MAG: acetate/propionate family kinase [Deltaproteobacteria bacterium]|nr:MAG: acetate/propionate family kinase [Deltaproteobacteria bacterium]